MQKDGKKQLLIIEPKSEIHFKGPYDRVVTEYFTLKNPTDTPILFKVKTTVPKRYCVRPNNGFVPPQESLQVAVILQPGDLIQEKNKHKFMIQSAVVSSINGNIEDMLKSIPSDEIMDSKFKCVFDDLLPQHSTSSVNASSNSATDSDHHTVGSVEESVSHFVRSNKAAVNNKSSSNENISDSGLSTVPTLKDHADTGVKDGAETGEPTTLAPHLQKLKDYLATSFNESSNNQSTDGKTELDKDVRLARETIPKLMEEIEKQSKQSGGTQSSSQLENMKLSPESIPKIMEELLKYKQNKVSGESQPGPFGSSQQMLQFSAVVVFVAFVVGLLIGKLII